MAEDLTTSDEQEAEAEVYFSSNEEYIAAAYNAIAAVDCLDPMVKKDVATIKQIKQRCLKIIDVCTAAIYEEISEDWEEEED